MSGEDLASRLRATFLAELDDQVRALNADLIALEATPGDAERLRSLFRSAHAVKGAARVAGVSEVEEACHALESIFARVRSGELTLGAGEFGLLFGAIDALADARDRLRAGQPLTDAPIASRIAELHAAAELQPLEPSAPRTAPPQLDAPTAEPSVAADEPGAPAAEPDTPPVERAAPAEEPAPPDEPGPRVSPADDPSRQAGPAAERGASADEPDASADEPVRPSPDGGAGPAAAIAGEDSVRVRGEKLDALATRTGELLVAAGAVKRASAEWAELRDELARWSSRWQQRSASDDGVRQGELEGSLHGLVQLADRIVRGATAHTGVLERIVDEVVGGVRRLRLRPFAEVAEGLPRAVRDIAARTGKRIQLEIRGQDIEADRVVIDTLRDPLLHLVRNAADHGIEQPTEREAAGKPAEGTIRIVAALRGGRLQIVVDDDGAGVDADAVRRHIRSRGGVPPADDRQLAWLLLGGGISTRTEATELSGRGVGLDLVRAALERIGGSVRMSWRVGRGTRFILEAPPTPTALRAVLVNVAAQLFALPASNVQRLIRIRPEQVRQVEGRPVVPLGDAPVQLVSLAQLLGPPLHARPPSILVPAIVLESGGDLVAVTVDELVEEGEIVVRPLDDRVVVPHVTGGSLLASGRIAIVLSPDSLVQAAITRRGDAPSFAAAAGAAAPRHILVVDDSITTRTLEQSVLEAAGYLVTVAVDGQDGWERLQAGGLDAVVADVEMPRMDGFELTRKARASKRFAELPIVLVTGLESADDRARGLEAGADAYIEKSSFDQTTLLDTIRQLIG
jgi:two-component system, chemotaxis family, sensor kinase CheA